MLSFFPYDVCWWEKVTIQNIKQLFHECPLDMRWEIANVAHSTEYPTSTSGIVVY